MTPTTSSSIKCSPEQDPVSRNSSKFYYVHLKQPSSFTQDLNAQDRDDPFKMQGSGSALSQLIASPASNVNKKGNSLSGSVKMMKKRFRQNVKIVFGSPKKIAPQVAAS